MSNCFHLTSKSKLKREVLEEFLHFFPGYKIKTYEAKTSKNQPIDAELKICIDEREQSVINSNGFETFEDDYVIGFENGIISDSDGNHYDVCLLKVSEIDVELKEGAKITYYRSFKIELPKGLLEDYRGKKEYSEEYCNMTFGQYIATKYPVVHDNWMSNYRFGGVDRKDQMRHAMTQFILSKYTRKINDYPKPGVLFKDISSIMYKKNLRSLMMRELIKMIKRNYGDIEYIASLESRGHYLASVLADHLNAGFIPIRKANKLPEADENNGLIVPTVEYGTEYSKDKFGLIVDYDPLTKESNFEGKSVLIVDDLLATGGSLNAAYELLKFCNMNILGSTVVYSVEDLEDSAFDKLNVNCSVLLSDHIRNYDVVTGTDEVKSESSIHSKIMTKSLERYKMPVENTKIIACNGSEDLAQAISCHGRIPICDVILKHFNNGETRVEIQENIRGSHIIVVCRTRNLLLNDDFLSMCMILDACNRSGCDELTVVLPYYPYARSDKKDHPRVPIASAAIANILKVFRIHNIISLDLHSGQLQGLVNKGFHNLYIIGDMCKYIQRNIFSEGEKSDFVLVSPDAGSIKRIEAYGKRLQLDYIILHKQRDYSKPGTVMKSIIVGEQETYKGKTGILIDDMADTMGTVVAATNILKENGLKDVIVIVTHGVLSGPAIDRINKCDFIKSMIVTNTLPQKENIRRCKKLRILDSSDLITRTLVAISTKGSVSSLFE